MPIDPKFSPGTGHTGPTNPSIPDVVLKPGNKISTPQAPTPSQTQITSGADPVPASDGPLGRTEHTI
jgi:hypothetical protein